MSSTAIEITTKATIPTAPIAKITVPVAAAPIAATATAPPAAMDPNALATILAETAPTTGALDALSFERLSVAGQVDAVIAWEKLLRHAHAGLIRGLGSLARTATRMRDARLAEIEVSAALAWSSSTAQGRLIDAEALTRLFPETVQLLSQGEVSFEQARSLVQLTGGLADDAAQAVEALVLPRMAGQSQAVTRQAIRRAVLRADPDAATKRHRYERTRRRVELYPADDGMATLSFYLPADVAQMAMRTLTDLAQSVKRKSSSDERTLDQLRADLLPAVLLGTPGVASGGGTLPIAPALVNVVVNVETLLGLSHEPGQLEGYGPICAEQTRRIARTHAARWRFLLTSSDGTPVEASQRTYTPRAAVKRLAQLKFPTCTFPHCRMPADRCDLDHGRPFHKGGPTSVSNLGPICRMHHNGKSFGDWAFKRLGDTILWTSNQTGRTYATGPIRYPVAQFA